MEKAKLIEVFSVYAKNFDFDDPIIALKYNHGLAVANLSYEIAESLLMSEQQKLLSYFIGLVHEIGSFENWKKTKTYQDTITTKQILFNDNLIEKFNIEKTDQKIVMLSINGLNEKNDEEINNYCKKFKESEKKIEEIIKYQNILLDANILDLFGMMKRKSLPVIHATNSKESLSKIIFKNFKDENKASVEDVQSKLDEVIYFLSLFYDLKFNYSIQYALKLDFAEAIYEYYYPELNDKERERLTHIIQNFKQKAYKN